MLDTERGDDNKANDDMTIRQPRKRRVSDVIDSIGDDSGNDSSSFDLQSHVTTDGDSNENYVNEEVNKNNTNLDLYDSKTNKITLCFCGYIFFPLSRKQSSNINLKYYLNDKIQ